MLVMFRGKNFNSFKNDVVLDLRRTRYKQHVEHIFRCGDFELLKTIAIYGANASGKSNLISAVSSFQSYVTRQFFDNNTDNYDDDSGKDNKLTIRPFLLSDNVDEEVEFEIVFIYKEYLFQYGFSIKKNNISTEWLLINNDVVFDRKNNGLEIEFGDKYKQILQKYNRLREDRLYISILDYYVTDMEIRRKIDIFKEYLNSQLNVYFELIIETTIKGRLDGIISGNELVKNDELRKKVCDYVKKIDVGIKDIVIDKEIISSKRTGEERERLVAKTVHNVFDSNDKIIGEKTFDLEYESAGTLRFISIIQQVLKMIDTGGVFIIDELSARLHPLVTKFIVDIFQSNKNGAQLIFTTHDVSLMNKEQFRRDEVVLVDKDEKGISLIYTLADLGVKEDATFNKDYFKGKYGALPIVNYAMDSESGE